ncbi:hypothetical protein OROHE_000818 [Orobanche hederae]
MNTDRSWMYQRTVNGALQSSFVEGVEAFIGFALTQTHCLSNGSLKCPCNNRHMSKNEKYKKYYFPHRLMNELWYTFNTVCSDKYKNLMNKVKVSGKKPTWMEQPEYDAWLAYWHRTDVEDVSYKNSQNRLSVPADGKGVAKHHFGSEAVVTAQVRALDKGEEKTLFEFFKRAKLNAKGAYVDKKSEEIAAAVESRIVDQDLSVEAINKIFLEVNPPDDKGFIYGLGSLGVALSTTSTSSSQGSRSRLSEERLREELAKRDAEYVKLQEEQRLLAEQMQKDKDEMAARFAAQQQQVEELFRQMAAMRGSQQPPSS